jgi:hypothetical protein
VLTAVLLQCILYPCLGLYISVLWIAVCCRFTVKYTTESQVAVRVASRELADFGHKAIWLAELEAVWGSVLIAASLSPGAAHFQLGL